MRGCPNRCRFCQANAINRPVRLRSPEKIKELCRETYGNTGYEQFSLLSLSSVNYPHLDKLVAGLNADFASKGVGISIPSLRADESFYGIPEMIAVIRKAGFTFAPETADEALGRAIGKEMDSAILCKCVELAYKHGWRSLKLYFMTGFPGQGAPEEEGEKILSLAQMLSRLKKETGGGAAEIRVSVNAFIPKPHTPFQWLGMKDRAWLEEIRNFLVSRSGRKIKVDFHNISKAVLEACLSRGDRRLSKVIRAAWEKGERLDGWDDFFRFHVWEEAFRENGFDIFELASRTFPINDPLPWGHIKAGISTDHLKDEFGKSGF
jgi:radical SAM superfamily enzyme YgiQ (UPF0313 family)